MTDTLARKGEGKSTISLLQKTFSPTDIGRARVKLIMRLLTIALAGAPLLCVSSAPTIQVSSDKVTVHAHGISLTDILSTLGKKVELATTLIADGHALRTSLVTANFSNLPFDQAISRLLRDWNYVLVEEPGMGRLKLFILGRKNHSVGWVGPAESTRNLAQGIPKEKAKRAMQDLPLSIDFEGTETEEDIHIGLQSENPATRLAALEAVDSVEMSDLSLEDIRLAVEYDPDSRVRAKALDFLLLHDPSEEATQILRDIAVDPDDPLREIAVVHLERMQKAAAGTASVAHAPKYR